MKPFARYLELVATVQYLHGRGHVFGGDDEAFYLGSKAATFIIIAHAITLSAFAELLVQELTLPELVRSSLLVVIWALALAVYVFLQSNTPYLQELRERIRQEPNGSSNRERPMWAFLIGSGLLAIFALIVWIAYAI